MCILKNNSFFFLLAVPKQGNGFDCGLFTCQFAYALFKIREYITSTSDVLANTTSLDFLITNNRYMHFNQKIINQFRVQLGKLLDKLSNVYLHGTLGKRKQRLTTNDESSGTKNGLKRKRVSKGSNDQSEVISVKSAGLTKGGEKLRGSKSSNEPLNKVEPLSNESLGQSINDSGLVHDVKSLSDASPHQFIIESGVVKDVKPLSNASLGETIIDSKVVNDVEPISNASLSETIINMSVDKETKFADVKCSSEKEKVSFGTAVKQFFLPMLSPLLQRKPAKVQEDTVPSRLDEVLNVEVPPIVRNDDIDKDVEGDWTVGNEDIDVVLLEEAVAVDDDLGISQELTSLGETSMKPVPKKLTRALQPKSKQQANKRQTKKKLPSDKSSKIRKEIANNRSSSKVLLADDDPFIGKGVAFDLSTTVGKQLIVDFGAKLSYEAVCFELNDKAGHILGTVLREEKSSKGRRYHVVWEYTALGESILPLSSILQGHKEAEVLALKRSGASNIAIGRGRRGKSSAKDAIKLLTEQLQHISDDEEEMLAPSSDESSHSEDSDDCADWDVFLETTQSMFINDLQTSEDSVNNGDYMDGLHWEYNGSINTVGIA